MRAAHLHVMVTAPGFRTLVTHIFVRGDERAGLRHRVRRQGVARRDFEQQPAGTPTPDGREIDGTWSRTRFDIVLAPDGA